MPLGDAGHGNQFAKQLAYNVLSKDEATGQQVATSDGAACP
jgi:hypothetical protein